MYIGKYIQELVLKGNAKTLDHGSQRGLQKGPFRGSRGY